MRIPSDPRKHTGQHAGTPGAWMHSITSHCHIHFVWFFISWAIPFALARWLRINLRSSTESTVDEPVRSTDALTFCAIKAMLTYSMYGLPILNTAILGGHEAVRDHGPFTSIGSQRDTVPWTDYALLTTATFCFMVGLRDRNSN